MCYHYNILLRVDNGKLSKPAERIYVNINFDYITCILRKQALTKRKVTFRWTPSNITLSCILFTRWTACFQLPDTLGKRLW